MKEQRERAKSLAGPRMDGWTGAIIKLVNLAASERHATPENERTRVEETGRGALLDAADIRLRGCVRMRIQISSATLDHNSRGSTLGHPVHAAWISTFRKRNKPGRAGRGRSTINRDLFRGPLILLMRAVISGVWSGIHTSKGRVARTWFRNDWE